MAVTRDKFLASKKEKFDQLLKLCGTANWFDGLPALLVGPAICGLFAWSILFLSKVNSNLGYHRIGGWLRGFFEVLGDPVKRQPLLGSFLAVFILLWLGLRLNRVARRRMNATEAKMRATVHPAEATAFFCFKAADVLWKYVRARMPSDFGFGGDLDYIERQELWHLRGRASAGIRWNEWNTHSFFVTAKTQEAVRRQLQEYGWLDMLGADAQEAVESLHAISRFLATSLDGGLLSGSFKDAANFLNELGELFVFGLEEQWAQFMTRLRHLQKRYLFHSTSVQQPLGVPGLLNQAVLQAKRHRHLLFGWGIYLSTCCIVVYAGLGPVAEALSQYAARFNLKADLIFWQTLVGIILGICLPVVSPVFWGRLRWKR